MNSLEKIDVKNDLSQKLSVAHDLLVKSAKIASLAGAVCGFIYLLSYTSHVGIPFPLELNVLPATLLIVGLTSVIGTFILIASMFIPAITLDYNDEITKNFRNADDLTEDVLAARFRRYFLCTWAPTAMALLGLMLLMELAGDAIWLKFSGGVTTLIALGWIFYTPKYLEVFLEKRLQYFIINLVQITLSAFAYSLIIIILIAIFPEFGEWPAWSGCIVALVIFTLFQIIIFVPSTKSKNHKILLPPNFKHETTPSMGAAFFLAGIWAILTVAMPQINYKIGGAALRAFHVGGDVPVAICLKTKPGLAISQRILFDADFCSEKLSMKLDSGDRVYISKTPSSDRIRTENISSDSEIIYFRQDEIKQKIYFQPKKPQQNGGNS